MGALAIIAEFFMQITIKMIKLNSFHSIHSPAYRLKQFFVTAIKMLSFTAGVKI